MDMNKWEKVEIIEDEEECNRKWRRGRKVKEEREDVREGDEDR